MNQSSAKPIYDKRVYEILEGLQNGKDRDTLAEDFGHTDYHSIDMYMRRRNFTWDRVEKTYVPKFDEQQKKTKQILQRKTERIIEYLAEGIELDEIAQRVGLDDIETLGEYMTEKGYKWDADKRTYIELAGIVDSNGVVQSIPNKMEVQTKNNIAINQELKNQEAFNCTNEFTQYQPSIEWLHEHLPQLQKLISDEETKDSSQFPRYKIRGDAKVKSIQMALGLQAVANQFCQEFNIVQKEFYEVAIIECLIKYGYHFEVQNLLKNT